MKIKKYELLDDSYYLGTKKVYKIRALRSFMAYPDICVKKGDIGGFVENEKNLSQEGICWIFEGSAVIENAGIYDMASINGNSLIAGDAKIKGHAIVKGAAIITGSSLVEDSARILDHSNIYDHAAISGDACICGHSVVKHHARVCGNAEMSGTSCIGGHSVLAGQARLGGTVSVLGQMQIAGSVCLNEGMLLGSGILLLPENFFTVTNVFPGNDIVFWKDVNENIHIEYQETEHIGLETFAKYIEQKQMEPFMKSKFKGLILYAQLYFYEK